MRVVTYYSDDVDRIASILEKKFTVDRVNSIDKRHILNVDQFGYMSLHYICYLPEELYVSDKYHNINKIPFEVQVRTSLQDAWAQIMHDIGYKSDVEVPKALLRRLNRLAGLLEIADEEFKSIRQTSDEYRKGVKQIVKTGKFDDVDFNIDAFNEYVNINAFRELNRRIQSINNMDVQEVSFAPYYRFLKSMGFKNLGDGTYIKVTIAEYFSPNGTQINKNGVEPDVEIDDNIGTDVDEQLEKAIEVVKSLEQ